MLGLVEASMLVILMAGKKRQNYTDGDEELLTPGTQAASRPPPVMEIDVAVLS